MPVQIQFDEIDRDEVRVALNVTMKLKEWKAFSQELPVNQTVSKQVKDELIRVFQSIR